MGEPQSDSLLELFRELLEDFPVILVTSPQDRGKTVCCLGIGTKLLDPSTVVVYSEAKDFEVDVAQSYIESPYQGTTIMMVDDVHLIGEDVAEFVPRCGAAGGRFKCLLISRAVSLPEDLRPLPTISLSPTFEDGEQMFRRNLKMLAHKATFKEMPNITEAYQNAGEVLQIIYAEEKPPLNLGRLYSFFHIWKPAMHPAIEVARNLDVEIRRLLAETPEIQSIGRRSVLLPIAALSSLEIPAHETYVSELGHEDERLELEKNILHKQAVGRTGSVYRINASDAQNYLEAAEESNKLLPLCVNAKEFVRTTIRVKPGKRASG